MDKLVGCGVPRRSIERNAIRRSSRDRRRPQHNRVEHGEDGRAGADAEGQCERSGEVNHGVRRSWRTECRTSRPIASRPGRARRPQILFHANQPAELTLGRVASSAVSQRADADGAIEADARASSSNSSSFALRLKLAASRASHGRNMVLPLAFEAQHAADHAGDALPAFGFAGQLAPAGAGDRIELRLPVVLGPPQAEVISPSASGAAATRRPCPRSAAAAPRSIARAREMP